MAEAIPSNGAVVSVITATSISTDVLIGIAVVSGILLVVALVAIFVEVRHQKTMRMHVEDVREHIQNARCTRIADLDFDTAASRVQEHIRSFSGGQREIEQRTQLARQFFSLLEKDRAALDKAYDAIMELSVEELAKLDAVRETDSAAVIAFRHSIDRLDREIKDHTRS